MTASAIVPASEPSLIGHGVRRNDRVHSVRLPLCQEVAYGLRTSVSGAGSLETEYTPERKIEGV